METPPLAEDADTTPARSDDGQGGRSPAPEVVQVQAPDRGASDSASPSCQVGRMGIIEARASSCGLCCSGPVSVAVHKRQREHPGDPRRQRTRHDPAAHVQVGAHGTVRWRDHDAA